MSKTTESANGQPCVRCGLNDGTTMARHLNGFRAHSYGKGRGIKCHDLASAELCDSCDSLFSEANYHQWDGGSKSLDRSEEWLHLCMLTNISRWQRGVIK